MPTIEGRQQPDLAVIMAELGRGGMGKMRIHLMNEFVRRGYRVDLLLGSGRNQHQIPIDERVNIVPLRTTNAVFGVPRLAAYLRRRQPEVILTQRLRVNVLAHRARALARSRCRIYATGNTHQSTALERYGEGERTRRLRRLQTYFARNDGIIAVSQGVASDLASLIGWPSSAITVAPNPVITEGIGRLAREPIDHPWFRDDQPPVIISVGRLQVQKDYPTLLEAFARFRAKHDARLVILGEGPRREEIATRAHELGLDDVFDMPGFVDNVFAYLGRSRVFVLSSAWEGFGNVLAEAMAVDTPVVATDCPSGPAEILDHGRLAPLVPIGDADALAQAIEQVWNDPPPAGRLRDSAFARYSVERSADAYLAAFGLKGINEFEA